VCEQSTLEELKSGQIQLDGYFGFMCSFGGRSILERRKIHRCCALDAKADTELVRLVKFAGAQ
jgi:hypothetical protein